MNYIHLKHYHTKVQNFDHPLLDDVTKSYDRGKLDDLAWQVVEGGDPQQLVLALRSCLKLLVGRFLGNWPESAPYVDDMVSEGLAEIVRLCNDIPEDSLATKSIFMLTVSRAQFGIEKMLSKLRSLATADPKTQWKRIAQGKEPIYIQGVSDSFLATPEDETANHPVEFGDEDIRDVLEALSMLKPADEIDEKILDPLYWDMSDAELSDKVGISRQAIRKRKLRLYNQFLKLTE
jgi:hypothetical protein